MGCVPCLSCGPSAVICHTLQSSDQLADIAAATRVARSCRLYLTMLLLLLLEPVWLLLLL
jgi:hypothetical protein